MSCSNGGANASHSVFTSTNPILLVVNWLPLSTHQFAGSESFAFTNTVNAGTPQQYFRLQVS